MKEENAEGNAATALSHNRNLFEESNDQWNESKEGLVGGTRALRTRHTLFYTPLAAMVSDYGTT